MLKVKDISTKQKENIVVDYYVPFTIEFGESVSLEENIIYWRTGNMKKSLIEIGIGEKTSKLKSITLTAIDNAELINKDYWISDAIEGIPIFGNLFIGNNTLFDFVNDFKVKLSENQVTVILNDEENMVKIIQNERIKIGIDKENNVICIILTKLNKKEFIDLKDSLRL